MSENKNLIQLWSNNEKRQAFMKSYRDWEIWLTVPELDFVIYRYVLPDRSSILAMEHKVRDWSDHKVRRFKTDVSFFVLEAGDPFWPDSKKSTWAVADLLKDAKTSLQIKLKSQEDN